MSHFTVAVITKEKPNDFNKALEEALQPYHEYECTGTLDKYVVWVDETEERQKEFDTETRRMLVNDAGELKCPYSDECYREPTEEEKEKLGRTLGGTGSCGDISYTSKDWGDGKGYRAKVSFIPDGYTEKDVLYSEIYADLGAYVRDWCGYDDDNFRDGQIGLMTNPNRKWDWWKIGGRYSGAFKAKKSEEAMQGDKSWTNENEDIEDFDVIQKKNIDVEAMLTVALDKAEKEWAIFEEATKDGIPKSWGQFLQDKKEELGIDDDGFLPRDELDKLRLDHDKQEHASVIQVLSEKLDMGWGCPIDHFCSGSKEEFISKMKYYEMGTFAILMDEKWIEKGKMGWWACVSDEDASWESKWFEIFDSIDDEHWITVVDCHI